MQPILSVVIPVYNEHVFVRELLRRVIAAPVQKEIIIVDDASTDGTRQQLQRLEKDPSPLLSAALTPTTMRFLYHDRNRGKGAAIRTGVAQATGQITLIQDADLEYDPRDYPKLLAPILKGDADVVYGSRFRGETIRVHYFWHALGNRFLTLLSNITTDLMLSDMETCYKAFRTEIIRSIPIRSERFGFEPEITAKIAKLKCRIYEVPITYNGRSYEEGKKITWVDGLSAILTILRFWIVEDLYDKTAGLRTLRIMEGSGKYNRWLFQQLQTFLGTKVLEVGAGVGNITRYLLDKDLLIATDFEQSYVDELKVKYAHLSNVCVQRLDLLEASNVQSLKPLGPVDTILSMNVLEHIQDHRTAIANIYRILPPGGRLVILVPAHPILFSDLDRNIEHCRRYNKETLSNVLLESGFRVTTIRYLNWLGAIGWFINGRIFRRQLIPSRQMRFFDHLMFFVRLERFIPFRFGLSVLAVAEKPATVP